jgi:hypothetical protein
MISVTLRPSFTLGKEPGKFLIGGWIRLIAVLGTEATKKILCLC